MLIETGDTKVICAASIEERLPPWLKGQGRGWVTAEYAMLPRSTLMRKAREGSSREGRSVEIQRLIGRSLRAVINLEVLVERSVTVDCDVLQADGGTRTAAITGAYVALYQALAGLVKQGKLPAVPLRSQVAAVSWGVVLGEALLDLCYEEDLHADVDFNLVMTGTGEFVELQGTAEKAPFPAATLERILSLGRQGISELCATQRQALAGLDAQR